MTTLKDQYTQRKLNILRENIEKVDTRLLKENKFANLLIEALDDNDLKKAGQIIDKLRSLKGNGLPYLDSAIEQAETELNKYTSGGPIAKAWTKMKEKVGIDNPLIKIMTFASSLETGFKQIPLILKNNVGAVTQDMAEKSLNDLVTDEAKKKIVVNSMLSALAPKGIFGAFKKIPYVDNKQLVGDLLSVPMKNLNNVIKKTTSGVQSSEIAQDLKGIASGQGDAETKGTQQGSPTTSPSQTGGTSTTKSPNIADKSTPTGEETPRVRIAKTPEQTAKEVYNDVQSSLGDIDQKTAFNVINTLAQNDKLKT